MRAYESKPKLTQANDQSHKPVKHDLALDPIYFADQVGQLSIS
jgi:hypothetical protein